MCELFHYGISEKKKEKRKIPFFSSLFIIFVVVSSTVFCLSRVPVRVGQIVFCVQ